MDISYVFRRIKRLFIRLIKKIINICGLEVFKSSDYRNMIEKIRIYEEQRNLQNRLSHDQLFLGTLSNDKAIQDKIMEFILKSIYKLPENQKTVIILNRIEHKTTKEVAEIMKLSDKAIESLYQKAKKNLEIILNKNRGI